MTPSEIYGAVAAFSSCPPKIICDINSACNPGKGRAYACVMAGSAHAVIDFDEVKKLADVAKGCGARKSVDGLALPPSRKLLCFIELKSWKMVLRNQASEQDIVRKAGKYESDLPGKLTRSLEMCKEIMGDENALDGCSIAYALVSDIVIDDNPFEMLVSDLDGLAGTASDLRKLCNSLSAGIMGKIAGADAYYWDCRNFDKEIARL